MAIVGNKKSNGAAIRGGNPPSTEVAGKNIGRTAAPKGAAPLTGTQTPKIAVTEPASPRRASGPALTRGDLEGSALKRGDQSGVSALSGGMGGRRQPSSSPKDVGVYTSNFTGKGKPGSSMGSVPRGRDADADYDAG